MTKTGTKKGTKTTVKRQEAKKIKMDRVYKDVTRLTKDKKVADKLIEKYGVECAYKIVRECMQAPGEVLKRMNPKLKWMNTADTIKFFVGANLNDATVSKGIRTTQSFVSTSKKSSVSIPPAVKSNPKITQTAAKAKVSNQVVATKTVQRKAAPKIVKLKTPAPLLPQKEVRDNPLLKIMETPTPFTLQAPKPTIEEQVEAELAQMKKDNPNGITLGSLKNDGFSINAQTIKESDFQYLHAGKDGNGVGDAVQAATKAGNGKNECGRAVRIGYSNYMNQAHKEEGIPRSTSEGEFYGRYCNGSSAAATLYKAFENNNFTVLRYPSGKGGNPSLNNVPEGTTVFFDKPKGRTITTKEGIKIAHPGHTATYNDGKWWQGNRPQEKSSISGSHYASYGTHYRIAIANDTKVDDELARKIIRAKIEENERLAQNAQARNAARGRA